MPCKYKIVCIYLVLKKSALGGEKMNKKIVGVVAIVAILAAISAMAVPV